MTRSPSIRTSQMSPSRCRAAASPRSRTSAMPASTAAASTSVNESMNSSTGLRPGARPVVPPPPSRRRSLAWCRARGLRRHWPREASGSDRPAANPRSNRHVSPDMSQLGKSDLSKPALTRMISLEVRHLQGKRHHCKEGVDRVRQRALPRGRAARSPLVNGVAPSSSESRSPVGVAAGRYDVGVATLLVCLTEPAA